MHPESREALLIAGMHRSGTSAAALALAQLGWETGRDRLDTQVEINRDGFGENRAVVEFNDAVLAHHGGRWFQLVSIPDGWENSEAAAPFIAEARALLEAQFGDAPRILLKDPRLCLLLPLWRKVLAESGYRCRVILQLRQPGAVAASLQRRDSLPLSAGALLWLHYTSAAERDSRDVERACLFYEDLLSKGAAVLALFPDIEVPGGQTLGIDPGLAHSDAAEELSGSVLGTACKQLWDAARAGREFPASPLLESAGMRELFDALTTEVTARAAEAVRIGEQHSEALAVIDHRDEAIKDKEAELAHATRYAQECEAVVTEKDQEIDDIRRYAQHCETVVGEKDAEIDEIARHAQDLESELRQLRGQFLYRLLRKLRVLK